LKLKQLIENFLIHTNILQPGEQAGVYDIQTAIDCLNIALDSLNIDEPFLYATNEEEFDWQSGLKTVTIGPSGNFVTNRPTEILNSSYPFYNGISYAPIQIISQDEYNLISIKNIQTFLPQVAFINYDFPNISMTVWPIPAVDFKYRMVSNQVISEFINGEQNIDFPPGYKNFFYNWLNVNNVVPYGKSPVQSDILNLTFAKQQISNINKSSFRTVSDFRSSNNGAVGFLPPYPTNPGWWISGLL
jgi:hypothetical protein